MKQKISLVAALLFAVIFSVNAINPSNKTITTNPTSIDFSNFEKSTTINGKSLTNITPNDIQKLTGKKLSLKEVIKLKAAQKLLKSKKGPGGEGYSKGIFILLALLGWSWLLMGIQDDFSGSTWLVNLLLTVLCWLPGFIHSLVHMKDYTK